MRKGQYYTVFKLMQGAIFAFVLLGIIWGISQWISSMPASVSEVAPQVLSSAYAAKPSQPSGDGEAFTLTARLQEEYFSADMLKDEAGLPEGAEVKIYCKEYFCEPKCSYEFGKNNPGCNDNFLEKGGEVKVCSCCIHDKCGVFISSQKLGYCCRFL